MGIKIKYRHWNERNEKLSEATFKTQEDLNEWIENHSRNWKIVKFKRVI